MSTLSCVIPCYNEQESIPHFYDEISKIALLLKDMYNVTLDVIFVDDGSSDHTLEILCELGEKNDFVQYISFSRNFGKEAAMFAGLQHARGDYVAILDADMQDPPSLLPEMYEVLQNGIYDSVATRRINRIGEPIIRSFFARNFYKIINRLSDADIVDGARDFRLMKRSMVDSILSMGEYNRFSKGIFGWVGFRTKWLPYENVQRVAGETKWSFWKLVKYSLQGIIAFSTAPLHIASILGIATCLISLLAIGFIIVRTLVYGDPVAGWPSLTCVVMLMGGIQLFTIGILGQYLAKTYLETKHRPIYIIRTCSDSLSNVN